MSNGQGSRGAPSPLPRFLLFYAALFAAFGVASPFLPALLQSYGLPASQLGAVLAAGTAIRLVAGPLGARLADRTSRHRLVLMGFTAAAALVALAYAGARGWALLLLVSVAHAAVLAPINPVADALSLDTARSGKGFQYGWVRGAGSAAFIAGALLSGALVGRAGLGVIVWLNALLLAVAAALAALLPGHVARDRAPAEAPPAGTGSVLSLLRIRPFACLMLIAALVGGSHALHDGFEVIRWTAAGLSSQQSSVLWALSVASEVVVFLLVGPKLLRRLGPAGGMALSAGAGVVRWGIAAQTAAFPVMAVIQPLHGLTFALLHLACLDMIARVVPSRLAATAQAFYGTVAIGATSAAVSMASGPLYAAFGAGAFWFAAGLCGLALPAVGLLRAVSRPRVRGNAGNDTAD